MGSIGYSRIGLTYQPSDVCTTGIPVLRSGNIQNQEISFDNLIRVNRDVPDNLLVKNGDILICVRNGSKSLVGKNAIIHSITEKVTFGAFMAIFRSNINHYVKLYLDSPIFKMMLKSVNTETINQITQGNLNQALIPIPPIKEQERIIRKITSLSEIIVGL